MIPALLLGCFFIVSVLKAQPNLEVAGKVKINKMDTITTADHFVVRQPNGDLAEKKINSIVIAYFATLPKGIQLLLDTGESPLNLINAGIPIDSLLGKNYAGGIIFYADLTGHGLVAANTNQSIGADFGCYGIQIPGAEGTAIGTGSQNTVDIVQAGCGSAFSAAIICSNLVLNGYSDWFLPSKDELNLIYQNLYLKGLGSLINLTYRSSSELDSNNSWGQVFSTGAQIVLLKSSTTNSVRAVRAF